MIDPTPTDDNALLIAVIFEDFEIDHTPDGWPAVKQMHLSAAAVELRRQHAEIERLTAENEALKAERARSGLAHRKAVSGAMKRMQAGEKLSYTDKEVELIMLGWQSELEKAVAEEREACAVVCDELQDVPATEPRHCAADIRARGTP